MQGNNPSSTLWLTEYNTPYDAYCHGIVEVLYKAVTRYQEICIVNSGAYGKALIIDGCWQSSVKDEFLYHEALVHPACLCHGKPEQVLILGGGEGAAIREVLKWKTVERVVMVDLDNEVVQACRKHLPEMHQGSFDDPRSTIVIADAYDFLTNDDRKWDIIISDLTDPLISGPSFKLFTAEFFKMCRDALTPEGVFVLQAGLAGPVEMDIHIRLASTVDSVFNSMLHYISQIPTWSSPMGFVLGTGKRIVQFDPDPDWVDQELEKQIDGCLRMIDGRALRGLLNPPKYLRNAIKREHRIFTLSHPPETNSYEQSGKRFG